MKAGVGTVISTFEVGKDPLGSLRQLAPTRYDTDAPRPRSWGRGRELSSTRDDQPLHRWRVGLSHRRLCQPVADHRRALASARRSPQIDAELETHCVESAGSRMRSVLEYRPSRTGEAHDGVLLDCMSAWRQFCVRLTAAPAAIRRSGLLRTPICVVGDKGEVKRSSCRIMRIGCGLQSRGRKTSLFGLFTRKGQVGFDWHWAAGAIDVAPLLLGRGNPFEWKIPEWTYSAPAEMTRI